MGLLDFLNSPDSRLGIGLLAAAGPRADGAGVGQRIAEAMQMQDAYGQNQMRSKLLQSQIEENAQQAAYRKAQAEQAGKKQELLQGLLGGFGGVSTGGGVNMQGGTAQGGGLAGMTTDQIAMLKANGIDLMEAWKIAQQGLEQKSGSYYKTPGGGTQYMPKLGEGMGVMGGQVQNAPGYAQANAQTEGMKAGAVAAAQYPYSVGQDAARQRLSAQLDPLKAYNPQTGREEYVPRAQIAQPQYTGPGYAGGSAQAAKADQLRTMQSELDKLPPNHPDRPAIEREMQRLGGTPQAQSMQPQQMAQGGAYAAGPSAGEASNAAASKEYSTQTAKDQAEQRKAIMNAGFSAPSTIAKYQQLGKLLDGVDGGKFTDTGTNIASAMNSLGIKIDKNLPNKEAAAALGNQMALELRNPANGAGMPGAMSDADRKYLVSMIPNASQTQQGRKQMIEAQIAISQRQQQVAGFARNYEKKYGRLDNGFFEQMQAWSEVNPLFNKGK